MADERGGQKFEGEFPCPKCVDEVQPDCSLCSGTGTAKIVVDLNKAIKSTEGWIEYFREGDGLTGYDQELQMMRHLIVLKALEQIQQTNQNFPKYEQGIVKLAYILAGSHDGPGSGPTNPKFWLEQVLGEGSYDPEIIEKYKPAPIKVEEHATCALCSGDYVVPAGKLRSMSDICPECEAKQPAWMTPYQKKYFALGVISAKDFVGCLACKCTGNLLDMDGNEVHLIRGGCTVCGGAKKVLKPEVQERIQAWEHEFYRRRGAQCQR